MRTEQEILADVKALGFSSIRELLEASVEWYREHRQLCPMPFHRRMAPSRLPGPDDMEGWRKLAQYGDILPDLNAGSRSGRFPETKRPSKAPPLR